MVKEYVNLSNLYDPETCIVCHSGSLDRGASPKRSSTGRELIPAPTMIGDERRSPCSRTSVPSLG